MKILNEELTEKKKKKKNKAKILNETKEKNENRKKVKNQVVCSSAKKCLLLVCILEKFYFSNY